MENNSNKAKELLLVAEAVNKGNLAIVDETLTPDFIYHGPMGDIKGIANYKEFLTKMRTAYPDIHVDVKDIAAEGDIVATRTDCTFTFTGQIDAIPPTGKKVSMSSTIIDRFKDGKLAETWEHYDRLNLNQQLGLLSANSSLSKDIVLLLSIIGVSMVALASTIKLK